MEKKLLLFVYFNDKVEYYILNITQSDRENLSVYMIYD